MTTSTKTSEESALLTRTDVARLLSVSPATIDRLRHRGELPKPCMEQRDRRGVVRLVRWSRTSIIEMFEPKSTAAPRRRGASS